MALGYRSPVHVPGCRLLACAGFALVFAGAATAGSPSNAQFVTRADAVCKAATAAGNAVTAPATVAETVTYLGKSIVILQHMMTAILALPAPTADRSLVRAEMNDVAKELASFRSARAAAASNNPGAYESAVSEAQSFHDAGAKVAKKLELKSCAG